MQSENLFRAFQPPQTWDETTGQVKAILATETPVEVYDREYGDFIPEILRMDGVVLPSDKRLPLVNTHQIRGIENVLGSCIDLNPNGTNLETTLVFSPDTQGNNAKAKVKGGHVRDLSVGYQVIEKTIVGEGHTQMVNGRQYTGPVRVATKWVPFEGSLCPIGADENAKTRSKQGNHGEAIAETNSQRSKTVEKTNTPTAPTVPTPQATPSHDEKAIAEREKKAREEGQRAEVERQNEIRSMCQVPGCEGLVEELTKPEITVEMARNKIIEHLKTERKPLGIAPRGVEITADEKDKFTRAATEAMARAAIKNYRANRELDKIGADQMSRIGFQSLAQRCLRSNGINPEWMSPSQVMAKILTRSISPQATAEFTSILANVANMANLAAMQVAPATWRAWCRKGSAQDFRAMTLAGINDAPALIQTPEGAEIKWGKLSDRGTTVTLSTFAIKTALTRQALVNDQLGEFDRIFTAFSMRWAAQVNALPYAILLANAALADTGTLFNATATSTKGGHKNQHTGAAISNTTLGEAEALMMEQTGPNGLKLNIRPKFLLCGSAYGNNATVILTSPGIATAQSSSAVKNIYYNMIEPVIDSNITGNKWFTAADPSMYDTMQVSFLDGNENLTTSMKDCDEVLGIEYLVYGDAVATALDFRGMTYNPGA